MTSLNLYCASLPRELLPLPVLECFQRTTRLVEDLQGERLGRPSKLEIRTLKEQFVGQLASLGSPPAPSEISLLSRQALSAGLLCGALDGSGLYLEEDFPEEFSGGTLSEELDQVLEVADQYWRGLDIDTLRQQALYGMNENRNTDRENERAASQPGFTLAKARKLLSETFRTGYGIGMIEAALSCLHSSQNGRATGPWE